MTSLTKRPPQITLFVSVFPFNSLAQHLTDIFGLSKLLRTRSFMKCDACGIESNFEAAFFKQRKAFRRLVRTLCPACRGRRRRISNSWFLILILLAGIMGYAILWFKPWSLTGHYLTTLFLIEVFLILTIVPHELGQPLLVGSLAGAFLRLSLGWGSKSLNFVCLEFF
jgi:hypothetical protein